MEVEAKDMGTFPNTASQNYTVQVVDKNDNRVTFPGSKTYRFRIAEELRPGTVIQVLTDWWLIDKTAPQHRHSGID